MDDATAAVSSFLAALRNYPADATDEERAELYRQKAEMFTLMAEQFERDGDRPAADESRSWAREALRGPAGVSTWPLDKYLDPDGYVTADSVRALIEDACPEMARVLRPWVVTILVSEPDPDELSPAEREVLLQLQLADLAQATGVGDIPPEPLSSSSPHTYLDLL
ncbi:MAG: hypothetical protein ACRDYB_08585 [Acidimicrobiales bacterium]